MSLMIESRPLTPEQAQELVEILKGLTISSSSAEAFIALRLAVERIASEQDKVTSIDSA